MNGPTWDDMLKAMDAMKREGILHEMNEPAPYTIRDLIDKERELARSAGAASDEYLEKWAFFMNSALGFATTSEELKLLAETPAQQEDRRRFYEGREKELAATEPKSPVFRTTYGMVEVSQDPEYHYPTVEDKEAYFEWAKWNQTGDGHGNYFTPSFDDWMQMMYPANYRHGRELQ